METRKGLPLREMNAPQRQAAFGLMATLLSDDGFRRAVDIMAYEAILLELEGPAQAKRRDYQKFYFAIYGNPDPKELWGASVEGHHLSINLTFQGDRIVDSTPQFFGVNPATLRRDFETPDPLASANKIPFPKGKRLLLPEEGAALELLASLDESQRAKAIYASDCPEDIQWPGQSAWAWGFRWNSAETRNGRDLLLALAGVDPRFSFTGSGFISDLRWDADLNGTPEYFFPGFNGTTGEYMNYFVNNDQQPDNYNNGAAPSGAHLLPPLGGPYDEAGPGRWVSSNTGVLGRPVVDGSWDGWVYSEGSRTPALAVNAPSPVPEASASLLLCLAGGALLHRRR